MSDVEERVKKIEELLKAQTKEWLTIAATLDALRQGLQEVCAQLGISEEQFLQRFQAAGRWHYDRLLQKASDAVPNLAAWIDTRPIDQIPTDERAPRILPEENP